MPVFGQGVDSAAVIKGLTPNAVGIGNSFSETQPANFGAMPAVAAFTPSSDQQGGNSNPIAWGSSPDQPLDAAVSNQTPLPAVPQGLTSAASPQVENMIKALQGNPPSSHMSAPDSLLGNQPYSHMSAPNSVQQPTAGQFLGNDPLGVGINNQQASLGNDGGILPQASMYGAMMQAPAMAAAPTSPY